MTDFHTTFKLVADYTCPSWHHCQMTENLNSCQQKYKNNPYVTCSVVNTTFQSGYWQKHCGTTKLSRMAGCSEAWHNGKMAYPGPQVGMATIPPYTLEESVNIIGLTAIVALIILALAVGPTSLHNRFFKPQKQQPQTN